MIERGRGPGFLVTQKDHDWLDEAIAWQFEMPEIAGPFWRIWGVRHIRAWWMELRAHAFISIREQGDWTKIWRAEWIAYAIRRGWC